MIYYGRARIPHPVQRRPNTRANNALSTGFDISSTTPAKPSGSVFCQSLTRTYLRGGQLAYGSPRARAWLPASVRDLPGASTTGVALPGGARAGCPPPPQAECRRVSGGARARLATPPRLRDLVVVDEHAPVAVRYTHSRFTDTGFPMWTLRLHSRCIGDRPPGWLPSNHGLAAENRGRHGRQSLPPAVAWSSPPAAVSATSPTVTSPHCSWLVRDSPSRAGSGLLSAVPAISPTSIHHAMINCILRYRIPGASS